MCKLNVWIHSQLLLQGFEQQVAIMTTSLMTTTLGQGNFPEEQEAEPQGVLN